MATNFTLNGENLRLFGMFCFGLNLILIYLLSRQLYQNRNAAILGCFLFAIHPMAIQGSLILDIDNTILAVLSTFFVLYFIQVSQEQTLSRSIFLGVLLFALLWSKLSTSLILFCAIFLFYVIKTGFKSALNKVALTGTIAAGMFLIAWLFYAKAFNLPYLGVFERSLTVLTRGVQGISLPPLQELFIRTSRVGLWFGPYFLLLWAIMIVQQIKAYLRGNPLQGESFCLLYISLIFVAYIFVGGVSFSFAKYQYPILPILCALTAGLFFKLRLQKTLRLLLFCLILGLFFISLNALGVRDLLYSLNYTFRQFAIFAPNGVGDFTENFVWRLILYFLPLLIGILFWRNIGKARTINKIILLSMVLGIIASLCVDIMQLRVNYFTTYCYGRQISEVEQMEDVFKRLKAQDPEAIIIGPEDVLYNAGIDHPKYKYSLLWNNKEKFIEAITNTRVNCVAYEACWNAIYTYRNIFFDQTVEELLQRNFKPLQLGNISIWLRK